MMNVFKLLFCLYIKELTVVFAQNMGMYYVLLLYDKLYDK